VLTTEARLRSLSGAHHEPSTYRKLPTSRIESQTDETHLIADHADREGFPTGVFVALLVAAVNLRLSIAVVGPLVEGIRSDLDMSSTAVGLLVAIPFFCMGAFALLGPPLIARCGTQLVLALALALIGVATLTRAFAPSPTLLILATVPIGLGIALASVAASVVIKQHFSSRPGFVNGAWTAAMSLGVMVAGLGAVSVAGSLGGWRAVFALCAVPAFVALPVWLIAEIGDHRRKLVPPVKPPSRRPSSLAVLLGLVFGIQSFAFAAFITWAPALLIENGWSESYASLAISSLGLLTIVSSLTIVRWSDRGGRRLWLIAMMAVVTAAMIGLTVYPGPAGFLWLFVFGIGSGATMPLCLTIPFDLRDSPSEVGDMTSWMLGLGYMLAATAPAIVGGMRDLTGGFTLAFGVASALCLINVILITLIPKNKLS
jgi:CP family cyanate transporter-like MFS transporter